MKKRSLSLILILIGVIVFSAIGFNALRITSFLGEERIAKEDSVGALANSTPINTKLNVSKFRESNNYYGWDPLTTGESRTVWKIANFNGSTRDYSDMYYCLNATKGFGNEDGQMTEGAQETYTQALNMKAESDRQTILAAASGGTLDANYNKVLWILDNLYMPTGDSNYKTSTQYTSLMAKAGITIDGKAWDLTEQEIEVVQQMVIWYLTNANDVSYHLSSGNIPSMYKNGQQITSIYYETDKYGTQKTGRITQNNMNKLFNYYKNSAPSNYPGNNPSLTLSDTGAMVSTVGSNYVIGPFTVNKADINVDSVVVKVNNSAISNFSLVETLDGYTNITDYTNLGTFYVKMPKSTITTTSTINVEVSGTYTNKTLTFMTNNNTTAQPVVKVEQTTGTKSDNKSVTIEFTTYSVEKVWNDTNNQDGLRLESVKVQLYKNERAEGDVVTLNSSNSWKHTWPSLEVKENGNNVTYTVKELDGNNNPIDNNGALNENYVATYAVSGNKTTITNTHVPETVDVEVEKVWDDANNQDGVRPDSVRVQLYKNGRAEGDAVTLNSSNNWKNKWSGLQKRASGSLITYTVKELNDSNRAVENNANLNADYKANYNISGNKTTITNRHVPEVVSLEVEKVWDDANNKEGFRPENVKVQLYKNGVAEGDVVTLNTSNRWRAKWNNLQAKENGNTIIYVVKELDGNNNPIDNNGALDEHYTVTYAATTNKITITNRHVPTTVDIEVEKVWDDLDNRDGVRPESVRVQLYKNGRAQGSSVTLDSSNSWKYKWTELAAIENGTEIEYTVKELNNSSRAVENNTNLNENYVATYEVSGNKTTITNKHVPATTDIEVEKVWDDQDNKEGLRPSSVKVQLYKNGTAEGDAITLDASNSWKHKWENLQAKENGNVIIYVVKELDNNNNPIDNNGNLNEYYTATYAATANKITITNRHVPEETKIEVEKIWDDQDNRDGVRPESITVQLYNYTWSSDPNMGGVTNPQSMGEEYKIVLNRANNWKGEWNNLPLRDSNGNHVGYQVFELKANGEAVANNGALDENYIATYEVSGNKTTITNKHEIIEKTGKYNVIVRKVDKSGTVLNGAKININGTEYTLGTAKLADNVTLTSADAFTLPYAIHEVDAPEGYQRIEDKTIRVRFEIVEIENVYSVKKAYLVDSSNAPVSENGITVSLSGDTITIDIINELIPEKLDLSLRKFITKVNDTTYSREPRVETNTIATTGTATYRHTKQPIPVQKGDVVTYTIRVYNEGKADGYVSMITDHLPNNVIPIIEGVQGIDSTKYSEEIEFNSNWLWVNVDNGKTVSTMITEKGTATDMPGIAANQQAEARLLRAYTGGNTLDYVDVQLKCLVKDTAVRSECLTNIAEIGLMQDSEGNDVRVDKDSTVANADITNIDTYKDEEAKGSNPNSYIPGQEDDDDFEKLIVEEFDLALRKFITSVSGGSELEMHGSAYNRVPVVDTTNLGKNGITTAVYEHTKEPVVVEKNDIVSYKIRVYNEGTIDGYANEITDDIPEGLEFLPDNSINIENEWKMLDENGNVTTDVTKAKMIVTDHISDKDENNEIKAVTEDASGKKILDFKEVEVQFRVVAEAEKGKDNIIKNVAQISEDSNRDIDSNPSRNEKYDYTGRNEDDIDFEPIKLKYFDLALRKFITKVNSLNYNNRYPEVIFNDDGTITYKQTKDPAVVETDSIITYTIRVYNEGEKEGTASEITDFVTPGLVFLPDEKTNKDNKWKMIDKDGNVTDDVTKAVKFTTDILKDEVIGPVKIEDGIKVLEYKDVEIAFKVVAKENEDRILVNTAEIAKDDGDDVDSTPDNNNDEEDDQDKEYVKVEYFDLSLKKWVTETRVTVDGKTTVTETGFDEDTDKIAKVDVVAKNINKTIIKFVYKIKVINEGEVPGTAGEIKDYIPKGLEFKAEDNPNWKLDDDGNAVTDQLKDTIINPGESATVTIVLTWKNSTSNMGIKTNYAEISEDSGEDIDSTPDNFEEDEDDIDDAKIIISLRTGTKTYIGLIFTCVAIIGLGVAAIKKYVVDK